MGSKPSYIQKHNIPPVGIRAGGFDDESRYIYKMNDVYVDYTGEIINSCFFIRNEPVTLMYRYFPHLLKDPSYNVGYITASKEENKEKIIEKFEVLKKLYDNDLCTAYFVLDEDSYSYILKLDKMENFKNVLDYKMSFIINGHETPLYPTLVYKYLRKDPVQKSEEEMRLERYDKIFAEDEKM